MSVVEFGRSAPEEYLVAVTSGPRIGSPSVSSTLRAMGPSNWRFFDFAYLDSFQRAFKETDG